MSYRPHVFDEALFVNSFFWMKAEAWRPFEPFVNKACNKAVAWSQTVNRPLKRMQRAYHDDVSFPFLNPILTDEPTCRGTDRLLPMF